MGPRRDGLHACFINTGKINRKLGSLREHLSIHDRLVGLVVRRPPRERKIPSSNPASAGIFSGSSHTSDLKIGSPVATHARRLAL